MGYDGSEFTEGFCEFNEKPEFKLYDAVSGQYTDLYVEDVPEWASN